MKGNCKKWSVSITINHRHRDLVPVEFNVLIHFQLNTTIRQTYGFSSGNRPATDASGGNKTARVPSSREG